VATEAYGGCWYPILSGTALSHTWIPLPGGIYWGNYPSVCK